MRLQKNSPMLAMKQSASSELSFLRYRNGIVHQPFHFFRADERLPKPTELNRARLTVILSGLKKGPTPLSGFSRVHKKLALHSTRTGRRLGSNPGRFLLASRGSLKQMLTCMFRFNRFFSSSARTSFSSTAPEPPNHRPGPCRIALLLVRT